MEIATPGQRGTRQSCVTWPYNGLPVELHPLTPLNTADRPHSVQFGVCGNWWLPSAPGLSSDTPAWLWEFGLKVGSPAIERRALGHVSDFGVLGRGKNDTFCGPWKLLTLDARLAIALSGLLG